MPCGRHPNVFAALSKPFQPVLRQTPPLYPPKMNHNWLYGSSSSGSITLYRIESDFGLVPGQTINPNTSLVLEEIVLSWRPHTHQHYVHFKVDAFNDLDPDTCERYGPTESIAGLFSFVVDTHSNQIIEVLPGALSTSLVLSTIALHVKNNRCLTNDTLTTLMSQEAVVSAEEIVRFLFLFFLFLNTSANFDSCFLLYSNLPLYFFHRHIVFGTI
jgi:hypothetical protein